MKTKLSKKDCLNLQKAIQRDQVDAVREILLPKRGWDAIVSLIFYYDKNVERQMISSAVYECITFQATKCLEQFLADERFLEDTVAQHMLKFFIDKVDELPLLKVKKHLSMMRLLFQKQIEKGYPLPKGFLSYAVLSGDEAWLGEILQCPGVDVIEKDHFPMRIALKMQSEEMVRFLAKQKTYNFYHSKSIVGNGDILRIENISEFLDKRRLYIDGLLDALEAKNRQFSDFLLRRSGFGLNDSEKVMETILSHLIGLTQRNGYSRKFEGSLKQVWMLDFMSPYCSYWELPTIKKGIEFAIQQDHPLLLNKLFNFKHLELVNLDSILKSAIEKRGHKVSIPTLAVLLSCPLFEFKKMAIHSVETRYPKWHNLYEMNAVMKIIEKGKESFLGRMKENIACQSLQPMVNSWLDDIDAPKLIQAMESTREALAVDLTSAIQSQSSFLFFSHEKNQIGCTVKQSRFIGSFDKLPIELLDKIIRHTL